MHVALLAAPVLLQSQSPGRGETASDAGGILIVVGIAVAAVVIAAALLYLVMRGNRARRAREASGENVRRSIPSEHGRDFSSGEDR